MVGHSLASLSSGNSCSRIGKATHAVVETLEVRSLLSAGATDLNFGDHGIAPIDFGASYACSYTTMMLRQPDGKVLVSAEIAQDLAHWSGLDFGLARLNSDGTPDQTFGTHGQVTTDVNALVGDPGWNDTSMAIGLQSDGKILVGGYT